MAALFATRRDLDGWARCLDVGNDDDASARLRTLVGQAKAASEVFLEVARDLSDVKAQEPIASLQRASYRLDEVAETLSETERGFRVHARGC